MDIFEQRVQAQQKEQERRRRLISAEDTLKKYANALDTTVHNLTDDQMDFFDQALLAGKADRLIENLRSLRTMIGPRKVFQLTMAEK